jgi:hypothetical protein
MGLEMAFEYILNSLLQLYYILEDKFTAIKNRFHSYFNLNVENRFDE